MGARNRIGIARRVDHQPQRESIRSSMQRDRLHPRTGPLLQPHRPTGQGAYSWWMIIGVGLFLGAVVGYMLGSFIACLMDCRQSRLIRRAREARAARVAESAGPQDPVTEGQAQ